jgi:hypothetical protein
MGMRILSKSETIKKKEIRKSESELLILCVIVWVAFSYLFLFYDHG